MCCIITRKISLTPIMQPAFSSMTHVLQGDTDLDVVVNVSKECLRVTSQTPENSSDNRTMTDKREMALIDQFRHQTKQ